MHKPNRPLAPQHKAPEARGTARQRGYDRLWERLRSVHLAAHPLCVMCLADGLVNDGSLTPSGRLHPVRRKRSPVVDHIIPIAIAPDRRLDLSNLQTLCSTHHDSTVQSMERRGVKGEA